MGSEMCIRDSTHFSLVDLPPDRGTGLRHRGRSAIGVSAPLFIGRAFVMPFIVQREVGFTVNRAIKALGKPIVLIALSCIVASAMTRFLLPTGTFPEFLFTGLAITTVYWLFVLPSLSKREWGHLAQLLPGKLGVRARNYLSANQ